MKIDKKAVARGGVALIFSGVLITIGLIKRYELSLWFNSYPLRFVFLVFISELIFIPRITVLLASGIFFHPLLGAVLTISGDLPAAFVIWGIGHFSLSSAQRRKILSHNKISNYTHLIRGNSGIFTVAILRILPVSHYSGISLLSGVAGISILPFIIGTFIGNIPTAVVYPYIANGSINENPLKTGMAVSSILVIILISIQTLKRLSVKKHIK